ncbi:MAG: gamma-glutamyltransferase [Steroidobacteraceae bacterium]|nr:gamma-glutamyltransferase [Steroidobacteraceae bacterium]
MTHPISRRSFLGLLLATSLAAGCAAKPPPPLPLPPAPGAVAMPDAFSADVAADVLERGGNAVDAAVAAAFVLAVTFPEAGNLGGGGFMLTWMNGEAEFLDYREVAPEAASRDMYLREDGEVLEGASLTGHLAAGVPGTVAGLFEAHRRHGSVPWRELVAPAIQLAEGGFEAPPVLERLVRAEIPRFEGTTNFARYFGALKGGDVFRQPELAATLRRIQSAGARGFYEGETALLIVDEMRRGGGLITAEDLAGYAPVWRQPLDAAWRNFRVLAAPPPSSGGFAILQLLAMKDLLAREHAGQAHNSPQYLHLYAEMLKRVFADRAEYLGDPDFARVPVLDLIDPAYVAQRAAEVNPKAISPVAAVKPGLEPRHTTHFSIVDRQGNAVSNTYTLNTNFGSGVVVEGGGFLLNNEMDDFSVKPGVPNFYGVVGSEVNAIEPGKRMLSSMSPTILLEDGVPRMVLGTEGGSTIITSVYQVIVNVLDFGMSPEQAVGATRVHHQLLPPELITYSPSRPLPETTVGSLEARGYRVEPHGWEFGDVQLLVRNPAGWAGASDPRGRGEVRLVY